MDELGIEPGASLQGLERAILHQDPALLATALPTAGADGERSILVAIADEARMDALLAIAEPLARHPPRVLVLARLVADAAALAPTTAWLAERASALRVARARGAHGVVHDDGPGVDLARLASDLAADLLLTAAPDGLLGDGVPGAQLVALLAGTPCDVALLAPQRATPAGRVLVPFGGADHDWAAVELGAWFARAQGLPLRLAGAEAIPEDGRRDASRLLSHGALAVQRVLGVDSEPLLVAAGAEGLLEASRDAGLLVVGLSTRWHRQGLGEVRLRLARDALPPTLFVRRGRRPGGLAPPAALTRFTWSIRA